MSALAPVKTSLTHPLEIQSVGPLDGHGTIGMTICPGRKGSSMAGGSWDRDLALDLEVVRAWQPDIVIALLEPHEFPALGIPQFRDAVIAAGLPWVFVPIVDGDVPDSRFTDVWPQLGQRVRNSLRRGGRVLIHCRAELGRTGLLAATLLVELGEEPNAAIARVRSARPGTLETRQQEAFVRVQRSLEQDISRASRIAGAMYGAAAGDALGASYEFVSAREIEAHLNEPFAWRYETAMRGSLLYPRDPAQPTDDTAMALSVAGVVANNAMPRASDFATAFLADLDRRSGRYANMFWNGGPGGTTLNALARLASDADPSTCGGIDDGANGAAMRAYPIGFLSSRSRVLEVSAMQARVTHGHPGAVAAAQAVAVLVYDALLGCEPELDVPHGIHDETFVAAWAAAHCGIVRGADRLPKYLLDVDLAGWSTVAAAHAIAYIYADDPNRAIAAAAASGKDTDTVATIVGAIVGARSGVDALDPGLIEPMKAIIPAELLRCCVRADSGSGDRDAR